ncbi:MAG: hypothetical protein N2053_11465, partial [Chitinispirillaceae bacterium]|nr:hypothetical protein [Chitinispirillaceae bacterium]
PDTLYEVILAWLEDGNWYNMSTSMKTSKPEVSTDNLMNRAPVLKVYEKFNINGHIKWKKD